MPQQELLPEQLYLLLQAFVSVMLQFQFGSAVSSGEMISFSSNNVGTAGTITAGANSVAGDIMGTGAITSASGEADFENEDLITSGG